MRETIQEERDETEQELGKTRESQEMERLKSDRQKVMTKIRENKKGRNRYFNEKRYGSKEKNKSKIKEFSIPYAK